MEECIGHQTEYSGFVGFHYQEGTAVDSWLAGWRVSVKPQRHPVLLCAELEQKIGTVKIAHAKECNLSKEDASSGVVRCKVMCRMNEVHANYTSRQGRSRYLKNELLYLIYGTVPTLAKLSSPTAGSRGKFCA